MVLPLLAVLPGFRNRARILVDRRRGMTEDSGKERMAKRAKRAAP
jgi:hypothetical protein